ncbi:Protein XRI1 [Linum perenne]
MHTFTLYWNSNAGHWDWLGANHDLPKNSDADALWNEVTLNEDDISYMFDETTPMKACGDLAYHVGNNDSMNKEPQGCRETSSQLKRRRMLQFDTEVERADSLEDVSPVASEWVQRATGCEDLDHSSERWLDECLKDVDMQCSPVDMDFAGSSEVQIDISDPAGVEFCDPPPELAANTVPKRVSRLPKNIILRGRKSFIQPPSKLPSSVAYPFAFIKPCAYHGDVTLKDINQRIHTPPPSKSKLPEDESAAYPTSAFSGKPVVGKTKIRTEGGKGSITIMRTKG